MKPDRIKLSLSLLIILTTISWITSCTHKANIDGLPIVCFGQVQDIYTTNCAKTNCHDGSGEPSMTFNSFDEIRRTVVPGDPGASKSYKAIITTWGENKMPPDQPLTMYNRTIIRVWIEQGANPVPCNIASPIDSGISSEQTTGNSR